MLCLARAGALDFARSEYVRLGLAADEDADTIALGARLLKDVALASRGARRIAFAKASLRRYEALSGRFGGLYGAINAATMTLVAGDPAGAAQRATAVLQAPPPSGLVGEAAYYEAASRAEALFLVGDLEAARRRMEQALALAPRAYAAHASTLRQLEMLGQELGVDPAWLTPFRPPACAHFTGHIQNVCDESLRARIDEALRAERIGCGYGGLAAGADIVFAEALLEAGGELHVVLPIHRAAFVEVSIAPFGENWRERFERCMARAASVRYASQDPYLGDEQVFAYASQFAMGCAVLRAQTLATEAVQLAVWDGRAAHGPAGVSADMAYWARSGRRGVVIPIDRPQPAARVTTAAPPGSRAMKAMLFADVQGFGALRDDQIPAFMEGVMGRLAEVVEALQAPPIHIETWGDGLFLVFDQPIDAALAALDLLEAYRAVDLGALGLPRSLGLRIGGHYGPVHLGTNPLTKAPAVVGAHVVVAARIEPDAAPGSAYVSEALAGALATFHGDRVRCGYVGRTQGRKGFVATPIFNLSRA
ncbi:adenylate/guanylate cyclase domain-containing protein [Caulobacter segnis]|uniref:Putative adenylate/guanylate cyclase n=1 Tax=Caulobacter segnis (strain ATCC 21756 / DSM 7131 / JCM 7823 / NBRC 15250 / LMG 17158 / TK0059) TaxID=509190 RepID=D5VNR8_CAUST|nr:putative adenylate/guanylate cyclase [Caulobacter segnis ATCC 21756]